MRACVRASEVEVSEGGLWPTWPAEAPKVSTRWSQLTNSAPASERGEPGRCSGQARPRGLTAPGPGARVGGGQAHGRSAEGRYPAGTCSVCLSWFPFLFCSVYGFLLITAIAIVDFLTILVPLPPAPGRLVKKRGRGPRRGAGARRAGAPSGGAAVGVSGALRWACPMSCDGRVRSLMVGVPGALWWACPAPVVGASSGLEPLQPGPSAGPVLTPPPLRQLPVSEPVSPLAGFGGI